MLLLPMGAQARADVAPHDNYLTNQQCVRQQQKKQSLSVGVAMPQGNYQCMQQLDTRAATSSVANSPQNKAHLAALNTAGDLSLLDAASFFIATSNFSSQHHILHRPDPVQDSDLTTSLRRGSSTGESITTTPPRAATSAARRQQSAAALMSPASSTCPDTQGMTSMNGMVNYNYMGAMAEVLPGATAAAAAAAAARPVSASALSPSTSGQNYGAEECPAADMGENEVPAGENAQHDDEPRAADAASSQWWSEVSTDLMAQLESAAAVDATEQVLGQQHEAMGTTLLRSNMRAAPFPAASGADASLNANMGCSFDQLFKESAAAAMHRAQAQRNSPASHQLSQQNMGRVPELSTLLQHRRRRQLQRQQLNNAIVSTSEQQHQQQQQQQSGILPMPHPMLLAEEHRTATTKVRSLSPIPQIAIGGSRSNSPSPNNSWPMMGRWQTATPSAAAAAAAGAGAGAGAGAAAGANGFMQRNKPALSAAALQRGLRLRAMSIPASIAAAGSRLGTESTARDHQLHANSVSPTSQFQDHLTGVATSQMVLGFDSASAHRNSQLLDGYDTFSNFPAMAMSGTTQTMSQQLLPSIKHNQLISSHMNATQQKMTAAQQKMKAEGGNYNLQQGGPAQVLSAGGHPGEIFNDLLPSGMVSFPPMTVVREGENPRLPATQQGLRNHSALASMEGLLYPSFMSQAVPHAGGASGSGRSTATQAGYELIKGNESGSLGNGPSVAAQAESHTAVVSRQQPAPSPNAALAPQMSHAGQLQASLFPASKRQKATALTDPWGALIHTAGPAAAAAAAAARPNKSRAKAQDWASQAGPVEGGADACQQFSSMGGMTDIFQNAGSPDEGVENPDAAAAASAAVANSHPTATSSRSTGPPNQRERIMMQPSAVAASAHEELSGGSPDGGEQSPEASAGNPPENSPGDSAHSSGQEDMLQEVVAAVGPGEESAARGAAAGSRGASPQGRGGPASDGRQQAAFQDAGGFVGGSVMKGSKAALAQAAGQKRARDEAGGDLPLGMGEGMGGKKGSGGAAGMMRMKTMVESQRRRRISDRLQRLRVVVNGLGDTASMLDGAIGYIENLQKYTAELEATLMVHKMSGQCSLTMPGMRDSSSLNPNASCNNPHGATLRGSTAGMGMPYFSGIPSSHSEQAQYANSNIDAAGVFPQYFDLGYEAA